MADSLPMDQQDEVTPVLPHLAPEFYTWLWWRSDQSGGAFEVGSGDDGQAVGRIELWVDDRLAFRIPGDKKVSAVLTGDNPAESLEAKAALFGGKVLHELRLRIKREDREFAVTLKGPEMHLTRVSLPQQLQDSEEEAIYDRLFLYDELVFIVEGLFRDFTNARLSPTWADETAPAIRAWVEGSGG